MVTVEGLGGPDPLPLANQSFLLRGQVIRSPTHQAALRFQSLPPPAGPGTFHFHYQGKAWATDFLPGGVSGDNLWAGAEDREGQVAQQMCPVYIYAHGAECHSLDMLRTFPSLHTTLQSRF